MWIERLFAEVQGKRPVNSRAGHQQGCSLCGFADAKLGESGTNHPRAFDSNFVHLR